MGQAPLTVDPDQVTPQQRADLIAEDRKPKGVTA